METKLFESPQTQTYRVDNSCDRVELDMIALGVKATQYAADYRTRRNFKVEIGGRAPGRARPGAG